MTSPTRVGLTLMWMVHHLAHLPSQVCQIPICLGKNPGRHWNMKIIVNPTQVGEHQSQTNSLNLSTIKPTLIDVQRHSSCEFNDPQANSTNGGATETSVALASQPLLATEATSPTGNGGPDVKAV